MAFLGIEDEQRPGPGADGLPRVNLDLAVDDGQIRPLVDLVVGSFCMDDTLVNGNGGWVGRRPNDRFRPSGDR